MLHDASAITYEQERMGEVATKIYIHILKLTEKGFLNNNHLSHSRDSSCIYSKTLTYVTTVKCKMNYGYMCNRMQTNVK